MYFKKLQFWKSNNSFTSFSKTHTTPPPPTPGSQQLFSIEPTTQRVDRNAEISKGPGSNS